MVAKLPSEFPIFQWESMGAIVQQKVMEKSGLSPQDQWRLLNASTPLDVLSLLNEIQNNAKSGLLTSSEASKITDQALRYSDERLRLAHGDASILPPLQKALWNRELDKVLGDLQDKAKGKGEKGDDTLYDWSNEKDNDQVQPFPFPAPVPVLKDVPYPANGEKACVFFTNSKGAMFKKQAEYQKKVLESQGYKVELVQTDNVDVFMREWDNMDPKTTTAVVLSHSNGMSLIFEENSKTNAISATGLAKDRTTKLAAVSDLSGPEIAELYIYACNAGHEELLASEGTNVADAFRDLANVDTVYAFDGSVGFGPSCLFRTTYEPRLSNAQSYDDVFSWFNIPASLGESGASGLLEYQSDD